MMNDEDNQVNEQEPVAWRWWNDCQKEWVVEKYENEIPDGYKQENLYTHKSDEQEPVAYADPQSFINLKIKSSTKEWMWASAGNGLVKLYTHPSNGDKNIEIAKLRQILGLVLTALLYHQDMPEFNGFDEDALEKIELALTHKEK
jgi:hypothetical protein